MTTDNRQQYLYTIITFILFLPIQASAIEAKRIIKGTPTEITDEDGTCRTVETTSDTDVFVPINRRSEVAANMGKLPTNVTVTAGCGISCTPTALSSSDGIDNDCDGSIDEADEAPSLTVAGSSKTEQDCWTDGGSVVSTTDGTMCRFNASNCPAGWRTTIRLWTTTSPNSQSAGFPAMTCSYTDSPCKGNSPASYTIPASSETLTTGSHSWGTQAVETASCRIPAVCNDYRRPACDDPGWVYASTSMQPLNFSSLCGSPASVNREVIWIRPLTSTYNQHGAQAQHTTSTTSVSANITQIGCR